MKITTKIKIALQKNISNNLFLKVLNIYRPFQKFFIEKKLVMKNIYNLDLKTKLTKSLKYKNINYKLVLDTSNGILDNNIYKNGPYEKDILDQFIKNIKIGNVCLDVGANIGHHSIFMAKLVGEKGKVISFEPIPKLVSQINESAKENNLNNLNVMPYALGEKSHGTDIYINKHVIGSSSLLSGRYGTEVEKINIKVEKLDDVFRGFNIDKIDFMKIDVEGYEYFVLSGAKEIIKNYKPKIIIEYSPEYYRQNDASHVNKFVEFFTENNYHIYDIEDENKEILDITYFINSFAENLRSQTNLLCMPK